MWVWVGGGGGGGGGWGVEALGTSHLHWIYGGTQQKNTNLASFQDVHG